MKAIKYTFLLLLIATFCFAKNVNAQTDIARFKWDTKGYSTLQVRTQSGGNVKVEWGDGSSNTYTGSSYINLSHSYSSSNAIYDVVITSTGCKISGLSMYNAGLLDLDLSANPNMEILSIFGAKLVNLDLSQNTLLKSLSCNDNKLTSLDLSNNTALTSLYVYNNNLTSIKLPASISLAANYERNSLSFDELYKITQAQGSSIANSHLGQQYIKGLPAEVKQGGKIDLTPYFFSQGTNTITLKIDGIEAQPGVDYTENAGIVTFLNRGNYSVSISNSLITSLTPAQLVADVIVAPKTQTIELSWVVDADNTTKTISLASVDGLDTYIDWGDGSTNHYSAPQGNSIQIEKIYTEARSYKVTIASIKNIGTLEAYGQKITAIDVSNCNSIEYLQLGSNYLKKVDVRNSKKLAYVELSDNKELEEVHYDGCSELEGISLGNLQKLHTLTLSNCTKLNHINIYELNLNTLDFSGCTNLSNINTNRTNVAQIINLESPVLSYIYFHDEPNLAVLDITSCSAIEGVSLYNSGLTTLNANGCSTLRSINIGYSQLQNVDVTGCSSLEQINIDDSQLQSIDVSSCTILSDLYITRGALTSLTILDPIQSFSLDNNFLYDLNFLYSLKSKATSPAYGEQAYPTAYVITAGESIDYTSQLFINGTETTFQVYKNNSLANDGTDYTANSGTITFHTSGVFTVNMENSEVPGARIISKVLVDYGSEQLSFSWNVEEGSLQKEFYTGCTSGTVLVDWGDGTTLKVASASDINRSYKKSYLNAREYTVTVATSEGSIIREFNAYEQQLQNVDLTNARSLESFYTPNNSLQTLDFSGCSQLNSVDISNNSISSITLGSSSNSIQWISIDRNYLSSFSYLLTLAQSITNASPPQIGTQRYKDYIRISAGESVDYTAQLVVDGETSVFSVANFSQTAVDGVDYSITNGIVTFYQQGAYTVSMTNSKLPSATIESIVLVDVPGESQKINLTWLVKGEDKSAYGKYVNIGTTAGTIIIDWGDGTSERYTYTNNQLNSYYKEYNLPGTYTVTIQTDNRAFIQVVESYSQKILSLNASQCWSLKDIFLEGNLLTNLDLSGIVSLTRLNASRNRLQDINLSNSIELQELYLSSNALSSLDLSNNTKLTNVDVTENRISNLTLSTLVNPASIYANRNRIPLENMYELSQKVAGPSYLHLEWQVVEEEITIAAGQSRPYTPIAPTINGIPTQLMVYRNGIEAEPGVDYNVTATDIIYLTDGIYTVEVRNSAIATDDDAYGISSTIVGAAKTPNAVNFDWPAPYNNTNKYLYLAAIKGANINIDWGDGYQQTVMADQASTFINYTYDKGYYSVNISTKSGIDVLNISYAEINNISFNSPSIKELYIPGNKIRTIDISSLSSLSKVDVSENCLFFSDMIAISQAIANVEDKNIGIQYIRSREEELFINIGQPQDYSKYFGYQHMGIPTICVVNDVKGIAAINGVDYTIADGSITFLKTGRYTVEFSNNAVVSNIPAKIVDIVNVEASSDTSLGMLQVNGINIPLSPNLYQYDVFLTNSSTSATVAASTASDRAKIISDLSPINLAVGKNTYQIAVRAENGTIRTHTILIIRQNAAPSDDATLAEFSTDIADIGYTPSQLEYNIEVEYENTFVLITAWANHPSAAVIGGDLSEGSNLQVLAVGKNIFTAKIIAEDGVSTTTYILNITRKEQDVSLKSLAVNGEPITLVPGEYNYSTTACADVTSALIEAEPTKANAVATGIGCQPLKPGSNTFTITVTSADEMFSQSYILTIDKLSVLNAGSISSDQTICQGDIAAEHTSDNGASGGTGSYTYQWEKSTDLLSWSIIPGATEVSYEDPAILNGNTYYRRRVNDGSCEAYSNTILVTVTINSTPIILGKTDLCDHATPITYTTEEGMQSYNWQVVGGNITTGQGTNSIQVQWLNSPTNTITVSYDNKGCQSTYTSNVTFGSTKATIAGPSSVCSIGETTYYTTEADMQSYSWSVTGGSIVSGQGTSKIEVTWTTLGTNSVAVSYDNGATCHSEASYTVKVGALNATITGPNNICDITSTSIYTTAPNMLSYTWVVTGGTIVSGQGTNSIEVEWITAGINTVKVTYPARTTCSISAEYNVTVAISKDIAGPNTICGIPQTTTYTAIPGMVSYTWKVVGGVITSDPALNSVDVAWTSAGSNSISVSYTNGTCSASASKVVDVSKASASITGPSSVCGSAVNDTYGTEEGMQNYSWSVTGGTIIFGQGTNAIKVKWTSVGTNIVSVSYNDGGCPVSTTYSVIVNSIEPVINGPASVCGDNAQATYTTDAGMTNYKWIAVGGVIISGQGTDQVVIEWTRAKTHTVGISYTNNSCTSSSVMDIYVKHPTPPIIGPTLVCTDAKASVYETDKGMSSYAWSVTGGNIITGQGSSVITVLWTAIGNQKVTLSVVDASGCAAPAPIDYNVTVAQGTTISSISNDASLCEGDPLTLSISATGTSLTYQWYLNDVAISGATTTTYTLPSVSAANAGLYYVKINGCNVVTSPAIKVTVGMKNLLVQKWNDVVLVDNSSNTYTGYQWYKNGEAILGATMQYYQEKGGLNGTYRAMLKRGDGGVDYTCETNIVARSSATRLVAYPIPITKGSMLNLLLENSQSVIVTYELFNLNGQRITRQAMSSGQTSINTSSLASGVYILRVETNSGETFSEKIIVK